MNAKQRRMIGKLDDNISYIHYGDTITVSGVCINDKRFMFDSRTFRAGDTVCVSYMDEIIRDIEKKDWILI